MHETGGARRIRLGCVAPEAIECLTLKVPGHDEVYAEHSFFWSACRMNLGWTQQLSQVKGSGHGFERGRWDC